MLKCSHILGRVLRKSSWKYPKDKIRNFSIIAHVDHGKSTLADRILQICGHQVDRKQTLDTLDVERERGITVKSVVASVKHTVNGEDYLLNLIDTPGHVDFSWEVQRSLTACEGVLLVVDASQGVQGMVLLNKVDLPHADVDKTMMELNQMFDIEFEECLSISAKSGMGVTEVLDEIVNRIPPPLPIDPDPEGLLPGQIGYFSTLKAKSRVTGKVLVTDERAGTKLTEDPSLPFNQLKNSTPSVFASFFPHTDNKGRIKEFEKSVDSLILNDPAVTSTRTASPAFGSGLRLGFLGQLHLEVFSQRLRDDFETDVIVTSPSTAFRARVDESLKDKNYNAIRQNRTLVDPEDPYIFEFEVAEEFIPRKFVTEYQELYSLLTVISPVEYSPAILSAVEERRGSYVVPELQMITHKHSAEALGRKLTKEFVELLPMQDHKASVSAHITADPDQQRGFWGSSFGTRHTNYRREDTTRSKANKKIDLQRRQKKIKAEKDRLEKLRQIGNVKVPKDAITSLFSLI
ncbi:Oidioi.mRNA.OKI2018_I69.chr2.g7756.t1.cds [Oikopleura dioica]|uniref:Oidioi.mRNA.OKI2018_I69.chr2.g7756.t1.cds n=1 Tax=Oikopleura dioica TaxID=34765 RepID=A0ABN7TFV8_OIKDI|nr:Oidioi.mRNA.OKI2018_I69.chr2.g7756.t1.cds [Oikopleura dioica]